MTSIAALTGVSPQFVSSYCTPDGPASPHAAYIAWLNSVNTTNGESARKLVDDVRLRLDEWQGKGEKAKGKDTLGEKCGAVAKETADLTCARLRQLPRRQQREEALEVIAAAEAFVRELDMTSGEFARGDLGKSEIGDLRSQSVARPTSNGDGP
jgi:hypothetical protein